MPELISRRTNDQGALNLLPSNSRVKIKAGDSWLILGKRGSGKTWFTKDFLGMLQELYPTSRLYLLDVKLRDYNDYDGIIQTEGKAPPRIPSHSRQMQQIWQPLTEIPEEIEKWLYNVRRDPPAILVIDELAALTYGKNNVSPEYGKILKIGRGLPLMTLTLTQELTAINRQVITQTVHTLRFRLGKLPYDINLANRLLGDEVDDPPDKYGFYYAHESFQSGPLYYPDKDAFLYR